MLCSTLFSFLDQQQLRLDHDTLRHALLPLFVNYYRKTHLMPVLCVWHILC